MIETASQAKEAIEEIQALTKWSFFKISKKVGVTPVTISRIAEQVSDSPTDSVLAKIDAELTRVRQIHGK